MKTAAQNQIVLKIQDDSQDIEAFVNVSFLILFTGTVAEQQLFLQIQNFKVIKIRKSDKFIQEIKESLAEKFGDNFLLR